MEKVLFCKIASMIWYKGVCPKDKPFNGGKYPRETGTCGEDRNFMPVQTDVGEVCFGFVELKRGKSGYTNQLRIENIRGANAKSTDAAIDDICVIWCATTDLNETSVIGWYKNATVYREIQELEYADGDTQWYNVEAKSENCVLLPRDTRHRHIWDAPIAKTKGYGFGQSMLWYASEPEAEPFVERLLKNTEEYDGTNWLYEFPPEMR